jgi:lipid A 3-O-deacylase
MQMRVLWQGVVVMTLLGGGLVKAQTAAPTISSHAVSPVQGVAETRSWEYGALIQGGNGLQDRTDFRFLMLGAHLGKVLTTDFGTGTFKGNIEYAVEVFPLWQSYTPKFQRIQCIEAIPVTGTLPGGPPCSAPYTVGGTYTGASITPIMLRYNFTHGKRFMPWIQAAGGVVWTNHKYPAVGNLDPTDPTQTGPASDTSVWNFTPQGGIGAHYFLRPKRSVDVSINGVHISSASLGDKNPGVNASVQVSVGYTWWK